MPSDAGRGPFAFGLVFRLLLLALLTCGSVAVRANPKLPDTVQAALREADIPASAMGIVVMTPEGKVLLAENADQPMSPASVMKVVTTYAAIRKLGPAYTWHTEVYADGPVHDGRLDGDLVIKGGGDPMLTFERLWMLLRDVRARGIRDITGDLVIDRTAFDVPDIDPSAFDGEGTRPYNVGPAALLVNFRSVRLTFVPDEATHSVRILSEPPLPEIGIIDDLVLVDGPCTDWPNEPVADFEAHTLRFEGRYPSACGEKVRYFTLLPPLPYAQAVFTHLWHELGGSFSGHAREGTPGESARLVTSFESPPLVEAIRKINKNSNNVMARELFLSLSRKDDTPATLDGSRLAVREALEHAGIATAGLVIDNGSGLSRDARITPETLAELLGKAWFDPFGAEMVASLPLAGVDGTLKTWFDGSEAAGHAHLKTGYLNGVRALAGYVHGRTGRTLVAVSIINHPNARRAVPVQEALMQWVYATASSPDCCTGMQPAARGARSFSGTPSD